MFDTSDRHTKIAATARAGVWFSTLTLSLAFIFMGYFLALSISDPDRLGATLADQLTLGAAPALSLAQALLASALWLITDMMGVAMMLLIRQLFAGIRDGSGIFTEITALLLRRIGWVLVLIAPASMIVNSATGTLLRYWADPTGLSITLTFEDADMYAIIVGLVLVAFGHIMVDAARLAEENKAFV